VKHKEAREGSWNERCDSEYGTDMTDLPPNHGDVNSALYIDTGANNKNVHPSLDDGSPGN
jgi:hypothetical protein